MTRLTNPFRICAIVWKRQPLRGKLVVWGDKVIQGEMGPLFALRHGSVEIG